MNKKDLNCLKKILSACNDSVTVNNILTAVINHDKTIYMDVRSWFSYSESEQNEIIEIIKKTLTGKPGKIITEYEFSTEPSEAQELLLNVMSSRFEEDDVNTTFVETVKNKVEFGGTYTMFSVNFTVTFYDKESDCNEDITFIATAFCPVKLRADGFIYNDVDNIVEKKPTTDRILEKATDGFLFPTESDYVQDVNHVMYYSKKPNVSIVENLLGCKYAISAERQRVNFWGITAKVLGDKLNFEMIISINEIFVSLSKASDEVRTLDCADLQNILKKCGVESDDLDNFGMLYEKIMGSRHACLAAVNICDEKVGIKADSINVSLNCKRDSYIKKVDGQKCLVIPLKSNDISVMGIQTKA